MNLNFKEVDDCNFCINLGIHKLCMNCDGFNTNCPYYDSYNLRNKTLQSIEKKFTTPAHKL